jgi:hypothetical protein
MKTSFSLLRNKWTNAVLVTVLLQQILVAAGTYYLGEITKEYATNGLQPYLIVVLFICIFLPGTLVHYGVVWFTTRASKLAQLKYLRHYIEINFNHPTHWRNEKFKQARHDIMCRGGQETIFSAMHFLVDASATSLNIILNTLSIILVTDISLGVALLHNSL